MLLYRHIGVYTCSLLRAFAVSSSYFLSDLINLRFYDWAKNKVAFDNFRLPLVWEFDSNVELHLVYKKINWIWL